MSDTNLLIRVECYAGHKAEETPRRFYIGEREIEVEEVIDRWLAPDHRYFKVMGSDGATYILRHDEVEQNWRLAMYQREVLGPQLGEVNRGGTNDR